ncbi:MAG: hypothetical protein ACRELY_01110 [Polyangiaceae bacterium]
MTRNSILSLLPIFVFACGGAASESPPSTTSATSAPAASSAPASSNSAPDANATANANVPYSSAVLTIPDPAAPDDKTRSVHIEVPSVATAQVSGATVNVIAGKRFAMSITEQASTDLHDMVKSFGTPQSAVQNAHVEKIKEDVLVYTGTDLGRAGYHFEAFVQTASPAHSYACADSGLTKVELTREDVDEMIRACKTLKH